MLILAGVGLAGFLMLLVVWLWIAPDREDGAGWWPAITLFLAAFGFCGAATASHGWFFALGGAAVAGGVAGGVARLAKTSSGSATH
jgi:hypothetical protein